MSSQSKMHNIHNGGVDCIAVSPVQKRQKALHVRTIHESSHRFSIFAKF